MAVAQCRRCWPTRRSMRASASRCSTRCSRSTDRRQQSRQHPEVCGAAGLLCEAGDVVTLATNLASATFDDSTRAQLVGAGAKQLDSFSWARCATDLAALYRDLVDVGRP